MKKPETKFKERVLKDLKSLGTCCYVLKTQERSRRGVPDIFMCLNGDFYGIELKTNEGKVDKLQEMTLLAISNAGGVAVVTTPDQWEKHFGIIRQISRAQISAHQP